MHITDRVPDPFPFDHQITTYFDPAQVQVRATFMLHQCDRCLRRPGDITGHAPVAIDAQFRTITAFHAHVLPEHLDDATGILADILRPSLRQADFDEEKGVILEEIAMYDDNPFWRLWEHASERFFGAHPMGHRVLGTRETIKALTRDQMQAYFDDRYGASSTVVCAAGAVDFDALVATLRRECGSWKPGNHARQHPPFLPHEERLLVPMKQANRAYLAWICPAPSMADPRRYAAAMLAQVLGDTEGSRLYWALIESGIAEEAQAQYDGHDGLGEMVAYAACKPEDADRVDAIVRGIDRLYRGELHGETINVATGHGTSLIELADFIGETLGKKPIMTVEPTRPGEISRYVADIGKAKRLLGYAPTVLPREGVQRAIAWARGRSTRA